MKREDMFDGITDIRDDLIDGAKNAPKRQKRWGKRGWLGAAAAVLTIAIIGGIFLRPGGGLTANAQNIAQAQYPEMAQFPLDEYDDEAYNAWWEGVQAQRRELGDTAPLRAFFSRSAQTFLSGAEGENRVYSPLNVYMALAMQAQLTGGETQAQLLDLLGSDSMDALRQQAKDVWNAHYRNDGALTSILASSLWLNQDVTFKQDTMDILAQDFYASSYRGEMGSAEFNKALQNWLNEQTGGLLEEQAGNVETDPSTILALATTVYFKAKWNEEFSPEDTAPQTFHAPGGDMETDFMHQSHSQDYYWGDKFSAVSQYFETGGSMWFLLPDEGVSPEELLSDGEAMDFLFTANKYEWENQEYLLVNKSIPKFDVASQFDLIDGLKELGITDIFDPARSDFTPMTTDTDGIILDKASHAARVVIDEEGCTAAAFTVFEDLCTGVFLGDEVDFVLDRPFIFCITGDSGLPLFVGIVNSPA